VSDSYIAGKATIAMYRVQSLKPTKYARHLTPTTSKKIDDCRPLQGRPGSVITNLLTTQCELVPPDVHKREYLLMYVTQINFFHSYGMDYGIFV